MAKQKINYFWKMSDYKFSINLKILYNASILENPEQSFIKSLNKIIFSFIWGNRERIKRKTLIRSINEGGIGITDFESKIKAIKAAWVTHITKDKSSLLSLVNAVLYKNNIDFAFLSKFKRNKLQ